MLGAFDPYKPLESLKMTTEVASPNIAKIHLTERAARKIRELLEKDGVSPEQGGLRVGVQGGGCSGLSYAMRLDTQARDRDKIFEEFGARLSEDAWARRGIHQGRASSIDRGPFGFRAERFAHGQGSQERGFR